MKTQTSKTDRVICGNCHYWTGKREPIFDAKGTPRNNIYDEIGNCECVNSQFCDKIRKRNLHCCAFSKWTEIL